MIAVGPGGPPTAQRSRHRSGLTLTELLVVLLVMSILLSGVISASLGIQGAFAQNQLVSHLTLRAQMAMDRIVRMASQALTVDERFLLFKPSGIGGWHCLRFRFIQSIDAATGEPVYDDAARVYIHGPDAGSEPCAGLIVGRGPFIASVYAVGKGPDNTLGTDDDDTNTCLSASLPAVEILIPPHFAPRTGDMFRVEVTPAPVGRLLTINLRINARDRDGNFLMPNDLVMVERIALRY